MKRTTTDGGPVIFSKSTKVFNDIVREKINTAKIKDNEYNY